MRVRMFKPQFALLVADGSKRQTIRPIPKRMPKAGDNESWRRWEGSPHLTPTVELAQVSLTGVERICISETNNIYEVWLLDRPFNGAFMKEQEWGKLANDDGFKSMLEMVEWLKNEHGLPFEGILIKAI